MIVTAPFCSLTHMAPFHFCTGFGHYFYRKHLPEYGFNILDLQENGNFFEYIAQEIRRLKSIAARYSGESLNAPEQAAIQTLLGALQRFSDADRGSAEILNFGCHVLAQKKAA